jgi:P4 family phage/plasmid primase-like protien
VFDFRVGLLRDGNPEDMCSLSTNIPYVENSEMDDVDVLKLQIFLKEIFQYDDQRHYMESHLASSLLGQPHLNQVFVNYLGGGANGKSTLVELMSIVMGQYFGMVPAPLLTDSRVKIGNASPEIAELKGKRYAVINEPSKGDRINEGIMKELTGDKYLRGRQLYHKPVTFEVTFVLVVCTNNLMKVDSNEDGTWRRMRVVDFDSIFTDTPDENDSLQIKRNCNLDLQSMAIPMLSFLVDKVMKTKGIVDECEMVTQATNKYKKSEDRIGKFISECLIPSKDEFISKVVLSSACDEWFQMNYKYKINNTLLYEVLEKTYDFHAGNYQGVQLVQYKETDYISKESIFLAAFKLRFKVTRNSEDTIKSTRLSEWAKLQSLKVTSSKNINPILKEHYQLDVDNPEHNKLIKINGVPSRFWIGIREILEDEKSNKKQKLK